MRRIGAAMCSNAAGTRVRRNNVASRASNAARGSKSPARRMLNSCSADLRSSRSRNAWPTSSNQLVPIAAWLGVPSRCASSSPSSAFVWSARPASCCSESPSSCTCRDFAAIRRVSTSPRVVKRPRSLSCNSPLSTGSCPDCVSVRAMAASMFSRPSSCARKSSRLSFVCASSARRAARSRSSMASGLSLRRSASSSAPTSSLMPPSSMRACVFFSACVVSVSSLA